MDYGVTDEGFVLKGFDVILKEMQDDISEQMGFDVSLNPKSALNAAIIMPMADRFARLWELAQASYYAKFPAFADGINLDNACQFGSVIREGNRKTEYIIHCTGSENTIITAGSLIGSTTSPQVNLSCNASTTLLRTACNKIGIKVASMPTEATTATVTLNGTAYTANLTTAMTEAEILSAISTAITATGYTKTITGNVLYVSNDNEEGTDSYTLSSNLTTQNVTCLVNYDTVDYGDIELPNGTITRIVTSIVGLTAVTNKLSPVAGRLEETDIELRQSYIKKSYKTATNMVESLKSYLTDNVTGIKSVMIFENATDSTDSQGRPPHSFETVIYGGSDNEIARLILDQKPAGIATYGTTTVAVDTSWGDVVNIKFSRPENVYIWVNVNFTASGNVPSNFATLIKEAILEATESLFIGDDVMYQKFISVVYETITNTTGCTVTLGSSTDPSATPTYSAANVSISQRQIPIFSIDRIGVTKT